MTSIQPRIIVLTFYSRGYFFYSISVYFSFCRHFGGSGITKGYFLCGSHEILIEVSYRLVPYFFLLNTYIRGSKFMEYLMSVYEARYFLIKRK